jgi:hypothetical protein
MISKIHLVGDVMIGRAFNEVLPFKPNFNI